MNEEEKKKRAAERLAQLVKPVHHVEDFAMAAGRRESMEDGEYPEGEGPDVEY